MVASALMMGPWTPPATAAAGAASPSIDERAPAVVLGLDSDEASAGVELTKALRHAFALRGLSGGEEADLPELRLALACRTDEPACLSKGGEVLGTRRLIYGTLSRGDDGWTLTLRILETESQTVAAEQTFTLDDPQLTPSQMKATAEQVAGAMMPDTEEVTVPQSSSSAPPPAPPPAPEPEPALDAEPEPEPNEQGVWFGFERPTPRWKWIGFGTSLGLTAVGAAATVSMSVWLTSRDRGFRKQLLDEANNSLTDSNPSNDVDPLLPEGVNLCDYARERPSDPDTGAPLGNEGEVRNANIVAICERGDTVGRAQLATAITTGVTLLSTVVFTGLLLLHRGPKPERRRRQSFERHHLRLGVGPSPRGGAFVGLGGRF